MGVYGSIYTSHTANQNRGWAQRVVRNADDGCRRKGRERERGREGEKEWERERGGGEFMSDTNGPYTSSKVIAGDPVLQCKIR